MIEAIDAARGVEQSLRENEGVVASPEHERQELDVGAGRAAGGEDLRADARAAASRVGARAVHATRR